MIALIGGGSFLGHHFTPAVGIAAVLGVLLLLTFLAAWRLQSELDDHKAQLPPAIRALREEVKYIQRRVYEWNSNSPIPELPDKESEWSKRKDLFRESLDKESYDLLWECFDLVHRFNRTRGTFAMGSGGFDKLKDVLIAADEALQNQLKEFQPIPEGGS